jgi:aldose 1-epimerase
MENIKKELRDGEEIILIDFHSWIAEIVLSTGGNLIRLEHVPSSLNILRTPKSIKEYTEKPEVWGVPVLFPPNRIEGGRFTFNGREYNFPINEEKFNNHLHGFLSRRPWRMAESEVVDNSLKIVLEFENTSNSDFFCFFPHEFIFRLSYVFYEDKVVQHISVKNKSDSPMPFGLGFHTAIKLPFGNFECAEEKHASEKCFVKISASENYWQTSPRHLPTGKMFSIETDKGIDLQKGFNPEGNAVSLHCPVEPFRDKHSGCDSLRAAVITSPDDMAQVIYEIDEKFGQWMLFNGGGGKGFFCPEPQTWVVNAPNLEFSDSVTGFISLAPEAVWAGECSLALKLGDVK